ncbi:hypothetical protein FOA52_010871 [Chlamydomonas sp. UWO 241]|nr:hypothetical protein FOA52_010871 [Chlamydomonas sp. UWO 241]
MCMPEEDAVPFDAAPPVPAELGAPTYSLQVSFPGHAGAVTAFLLDLSGHKQIHPLMVRAERVSVERLLSNGVTSTQAWTATEAPRVLGFRRTMTFPARSWHAAGSNSIAWSASAGFGVYIRHIYDVTDTAAESPESPVVTVHQRTWVSAPRLLRGYVTSVAKAAHMSQLARLRKLWEAGGPAKASS